MSGTSPAAGPAAPNAPTRLILHAGFHKTGTTSIQAQLAKSPPAGADYLDWGDSPNHSHGFLFAFCGRDCPRYSGPDGSAPDARRAEMRDDLARAVRAARQPVLIVSGEEFSNAGYEAALREFKAVVAPLVARIEVKAYIRPPVGMVCSQFQQLLKHGIRPAFPGTVRYRRRIAALDRVFGREAVAFRVYDPARLPDGDVIADFCSFAGLEPSGAAGPLRANAAMSREMTAILYTAAQAPDDAWRFDVAVRAGAGIFGRLRDFGTEPLAFGPVAAAAVLDGAQDDLDWVAERIGAPLAEAGGQAGGIDSEADLVALALDQAPAFAQALREAFPRHRREIDAIEAERSGVDRVRHLLRAGLEAAGAPG